MNDIEKARRFDLIRGWVNYAAHEAINIEPTNAEAMLVYRLTIRDSSVDEAREQTERLAHS